MGRRSSAEALRARSDRSGAQGCAPSIPAPSHAATYQINRCRFIRPKVTETTSNSQLFNGARIPHNSAPSERCRSWSNGPDSKSGVSLRAPRVRPIGRIADWGAAAARRRFGREATEVAHRDVRHQSLPHPTLQPTKSTVVGSSAPKSPKQPPTHSCSMALAFRTIALLRRGAGVGRTGLTRNQVCPCGHPGFESLPLRQTQPQPTVL